MSTSRKQRHIGKTVAAILLTIILVINILVIFSEQKEGAGILSNLPVSIIPVAGSSMEPVLSSGDAVLTVKTPFYRLKTGDIIVFARGGELITHEIIARDRETLTTKGTANEIADSPVSLNEYLVRVVCRIPMLGALWRIGSSASRFAIFAVLVTLLIFGKDIFSALYGKAFNEEDEQGTQESN